MFSFVCSNDSPKCLQTFEIASTVFPQKGIFMIFPLCFYVQFKLKKVTIQIFDYNRDIFFTSINYNFPVICEISNFPLIF